MRKNVVLLFIFVLTMFVRIGGVSAVKIDINAVGSDAQKSSACRTDICASTHGISKKVGNYPIDGIRVILKDKSHKTIATKDLWFTINKASFVGSNNNIEKIFEKYEQYNDDIFDYNNFLGKLNEQDVEAILQKINSNYNLADTKDYYMVVEPIFVLQYAYYHDATNGEYTFYIKGTPKEVVQTLLNLGSTAAVNNGAKYFVYNDYSNCNDKVGWSASAGCKNWNVIRNYFTTFKLATTFGNFKTSSETYVDQMAASYNTNIFGKGIIKISDYAKGELKIVKKDNNDETVYSAQFNIYEGSGCNSSKIKYKNKTVPGTLLLELEPGDYSIKEVYNDPDYYDAPDGSCVNVKVENGKTTTKTFVNNLSCDGELIKINTENTIGSAAWKNAIISLYNFYPSKKKLLNFDDPKCEPVTCTSPLNYVGCLSASFTPRSTFNENNLSCFTNKINVSDKTAFCQTYLTVSNYGYTSPFSGKAGQMYITSSDGKAVKSKLEMLCYLFDDSLSLNNKVNYTDYLSWIQFDKKNNGDPKHLNRDVSQETDITFEKQGNTSLYKGAVTIDYYFKKLYSNNITGEVEEVKYSDAAPASNYKYLGYGKVSKLTDSGTQHIPFKLTLYLNGKANSGIDFESNCDVNITQEIIENSKPELVFRPVNTQVTDGKNAFLNKDGSIRTPKANWIGKEDIITNTNNSYNKNGSDPKYVIILTPDTIKEIRKYNKNHAYDDYDFTCKPTGEAANKLDGGNVCMSNYLTTLSGLNTINGKKVVTINNSKIRNCFEGSNRTKTYCNI